MGQATVSIAFAFLFPHPEKLKHAMDKSIRKPIPLNVISTDFCPILIQFAFHLQGKQQQKGEDRCVLRENDGDQEVR